MVVVALPQWWRQHPTSASTLTYGDRNIGASRQFHQSVIVAKVFIIIVVWNIYIYIYIYMVESTICNSRLVCAQFMPVGKVVHLSKP